MVESPFYFPWDKFKSWNLGIFLSPHELVLYILWEQNAKRVRREDSLEGCTHKSTRLYLCRGFMVHFVSSFFFLLFYILQVSESQWLLCNIRKKSATKVWLSKNKSIILWKFIQAVMCIDNLLHFFAQYGCTTVCWTIHPFEGPPDCFYCIMNTVSMNIYRQTVGCTLGLCFSGRNAEERNSWATWWLYVWFHKKLASLWHEDCEFRVVVTIWISNTNSAFCKNLRHRISRAFVPCTCFSCLTVVPGTLKLQKCSF